MDSFGDLTEVNTNVVLENLCVSQDLRLSRRDLGCPVSPALPLQAQRNTSSRASSDTCSFDLAVAFYQEIPLPCGFCSGSSLEDCLFNHCFVSEKTPRALAYVGRVCDPTCTRSFTAGAQPGAPARVTASPGPGSRCTAPVSRHCGKGWAGLGENLLSPSHPRAAFSESSQRSLSLSRGAGRVPLPRVREEGPHGSHSPVCFSGASVILGRALPLLVDRGCCLSQHKGAAASVRVSAEQRVPGGDSF